MAKLCTTSRVRKSKTEADTLAQRESQHSSGVDVQEADTGPTLHSTHSRASESLAKTQSALN